MKELSVGASIAWQFAAQEASISIHQYIEKEHLLIGILSIEKILILKEKSNLDKKRYHILQQEFEVIKKVFESSNLSLSWLRRKIRDGFGKGSYKHKDAVIHRSEDCKTIFKRAEKLSLQREVSCLDFLKAIFEEPGENIKNILTEKNVNLEKLLDFITNLEKEIKEPSPEMAGEELPEPTLLERFGRDLTREAKEGKLGPIVGRRKEILQVIQTLARSTKNNPVLVGEAGVGKTAVVEALAIRIAEGKDPHILSDKRIIELNMGTLIGGTKYRGEFEERLTNIIEEVRNHPEIILFMDEIHTVVGAGKGEGSLDAANLMKPALARGDFKCIGATTITEYRRYIESDSALERRFEKIIVDEPSLEESLDILKGLRSKWEKHHHVRISDPALKAAIDLSIKFDTDHKLPDKAIDLVDKAGAYLQIPDLSLKFERREDKELLKEKFGIDDIYSEVDEKTIARVLSDKIGVPMEIITGHLEGTVQTRFLDLRTFLKNRLIGQDDAVEKICQRLLSVYSGISRRYGPLAVFLFLGPTGVGKTEMTKLLAKFLFGDELTMIRLDMSEYMEEHSVAKLIGSPPGYIGYQEEGQLTGKLRSKPNSIVLLDEIEKAHPRVFDLFLQVFDEGFLTDSKGKKANAKNAIFIMTSNIQVRDKHIGFGKKETDTSKDIIIDEIKKRFRPEFINRIDEIIAFHSLDEADVQKILKPMINEITENLLKSYNVTLLVGKEAEKFLIREGYNFQFGVRELHRTLERYIQFPLSEIILSGKIKTSKSWHIIYGKGKISIIPHIKGELMW
jgi:ATP-dependent Clp protease ATP-binding subunit ClpC